MQLRYRRQRPPSVAMAFMNEVLDFFARGQLDRPVSRKLDHPANCIVSGWHLLAFPADKLRQGSIENFFDRAESSGSKLFLNDSLLLGLEFNSHRRRQRTPSRYEKSAESAIEDLVPLAPL